MVTARESAAVDALISRHGGPPAERREVFNPGRYPYTYACDYFRQRTMQNYSRAAASGLTRAFAAEQGLDPDALFMEMADRYLDAAGVEVSQAAKVNALLEKPGHRS